MLAYRFIDNASYTMTNTLRSVYEGFYSVEGLSYHWVLPPLILYRFGILRTYKGPGESVRIRMMEVS